MWHAAVQRASRVACGTALCALAIAQVKALVEGAAPKSEKKRRFDHSSELGGLEAEVEDLVGSICDSESKAALTRTLALTLSLKPKPKP